MFMAVKVLNDLEAPVEVKDPESETWKVVYPKQSLLLPGDEVTQVRLREEPAVQSTSERQGTLRTSEDFGEVSTRGKDLDFSHQRSVAREKNRQEMATERKQRLRQARKEFNVELLCLCCMVGCILGVFPPLLFVVASATPEHYGEAFGLAVAAALLCCFVFSMEKVEGGGRGSYCTPSVACASCSLCVGGLLCFAALVWMTIRDGFGWTFFIVWPVACLCGWRIEWVCCERGWEDSGAVSLGAFNVEVVEAEIQRRSIRFEGSVIREVGRPCITSWPGKYEGAWERLVAESRQGQVSAAVVFLPDGFIRLTSLWFASGRAVGKPTSSRSQTQLLRAIRVITSAARLPCGDPGIQIHLHDESPF
ncbi:ADAMTS9 [Symbiodinium sp. CCMP2592]|nr:ADAMTS9 [Symbiodinium sp. CCMP2592]